MVTVGFASLFRVRPSLAMFPVTLETSRLMLEDTALEGWSMCMHVLSDDRLSFVSVLFFHLGRRCSIRDEMLHSDPHL